MIEQSKFSYAALGETFGKQTKAVENQGTKQINAIMNQKEKKQVDVTDDNHNLSLRENRNI